MSTSEFFEDNKIARARRGSAICCWKLKNFFFLQALIMPNCKRNTGYLSKWKTTLKVKTKFWKRTGAISNLHSCYNFALGIIWECTCGASGSEQSMQEKNKSEIVLTLKLLKNLSNSNESNHITGKWKQETISYTQPSVMEQFITMET